MPVGSASSGMKIIHVDAIRWTGSLEWAGKYGSMLMQLILALNQFFTYELTLANRLISKEKYKDSGQLFNQQGNQKGLM